MDDRWMDTDGWVDEWRECKGLFPSGHSLGLKDKNTWLNLLYYNNTLLLLNKGMLGQV